MLPRSFHTVTNFLIWVITWWEQQFMPILNNKKKNEQTLQLVYCILKIMRWSVKFEMLIQVTTLGKGVYRKTTQAEMSTSLKNIVQMEFKCLADKSTASPVLPQHREKKRKYIRHWPHSCCIKSCSQSRWKHLTFTDYRTLSVLVRGFMSVIVKGNCTFT